MLVKIIEILKFLTMFAQACEQIIRYFHEWDLHFFW